MGPATKPITTSAMASIRICMLILSAAFPLGVAHSACTVLSSAPSLNVGNTTFGAMPPSAVPGYRRMGVRQVSITGNCDRSMSSLRLSFEGLEAISAVQGGQNVSHWSNGTAILFHASAATVGGVPVQMTLVGASKPDFRSSLDLSQNSIVELDVGRIPTDARKSFALQIELTALVPENYVSRSKVQLNRQFSVRLLSTE